MSPVKHDGDGGGRGRSTGGSAGSVGHLLRETADGMGRLVIQHIKLAQLEIVTGLRSMAARSAALAVYLVLALVGYILAITGVCIFLGQNDTLAIPFLAIGGLHIGIAATGLLVTIARLRRTSLLTATTSELNQSAKVLGAATHEQPRPAPSVAPRVLEQAHGR